MNGYYIDFPLTIYATVLVTAEDSFEANEIAKRLWDSDEFFEDHLLEQYRSYEILPENGLEPEVVGCGTGYVRTDDMLFRDERYMSAEEIARYIEG